MTNRFTAKKLESVPTKSGYGDHQKIGVFDGDGQIG